MNIADALEYRARRQPWAAAFVTPTQVISYAEVAERVRRTAAALRARGVGAADRVALRLPNSPSFVLAVFALARLGAVAVALPARRPADQLSDMVTRHRVVATLALTEADALPDTRLLLFDDSLLKPLPADRPAEPPAPGGDALTLVTLSSGTTGAPKAMGRSHSCVLRQWEQQQKLRPHGPGVRMLILLGLDAAYAAQAALRMLFSGATVVLTRDAGLASLADAVDRLGANHVLASPAIVGRWIDQLPVDGQRFPGLATFRLAGSLVPPALFAQLRRRLSPVVCSDYGASEVGALADGDPELALQRPGCVGYLMPWVQAEAVDDESRPLPLGGSGRLRFRSEIFGSGYLDDAEASARTFVDGWFYTGDRGRVDADGSLTIEGRADDVINVGGTKVQPDEVEQVLLQDPAISEAAVYGVQSETGKTVLVAAVVCRAPLDERLTLERCQALLGQRAPRHLVRLDRLPRNEGGKVLRRELVRRTRLSSAATRNEPPPEP